MSELKTVLPRRVSRAILLFVLPLPLVAELLGSLMKGELVDVLASAGALCLFAAAGVFMRRGLLQDAVVSARSYIVKRPPPLKLFGALLAGVATVVTSIFLVETHVLWESVAYGIGATVGCVLLYGTDPRPRWSVADADRARFEESMRALADAEEKVLAIEQANSAIENDELTLRLDRISGQARDILNVLADKPDQVRRARRFLNSYLDGARQVADGYAKTHRRAGSEELETNFRSVLVTIEEAFEEQHRKLLDDDVMDLDVKIEVLRTQLEKEGV